MIKVLVVEDSITSRELLAAMLETDRDIKVIGRARNGQEAIAFLENGRLGLKPDIITMDVFMPVMDGLETTRRIMETTPMPIVMISAAWKPTEVALTFRAMEAGALAIIEKPAGPLDPQFEARSRKLIQTVKLMAEVKVVRRRPRPPRNVSAPQISARLASPVPEMPPQSTRVRGSNYNRVPRVVAIGASTGGPPALQSVLTNLPKDFSLPILIVQHITEGFLDGLARWLGETTGFPVHIGIQDEEAAPGHVYLAPDGMHLGLSARGRLLLDGGEPENGSRPSVSYLFRSVEQSGLGAIGVLLTGMGRDGARELKMLKDSGHLTIAQDQATSVVHGMPGEAIVLGGASQVLPVEQIGLAISAAVTPGASHDQPKSVEPIT